MFVCKTYNMTNFEDQLLHKLILHFFKGSVNFILEENEVNLMSWTVQEKFIHRTIESELNKRFPLRNKFVKLFLKKILTFIEPVHDIHDQLYMCLCSAINNENNMNDFYYRHYVINNNLNTIITMKETNNMVVNGTTGMRTWEAALILADWGITNKALLTGKKILELGSGIGFTGITIAKFCNPKTIMLSDCHNDVLRSMCDNIEINFSMFEKETENDVVLYRNDQTCLGVMNLDWNDVTKLSQKEIPDILIGADIVYDSSIMQPLCSLLWAFSERNKQLQIYICSIIRNEATINKFLECLDINGFKFEHLKIENVNIEWEQNISICFLKIVPQQ